MATFNHRAKKFAGSCAAVTKLGRKAIAKQLGVHGESLMQSLHQSLLLHFGSRDGQLLHEDLMRLILKINILAKDKVLTPENCKDATEPTLQLLQLTKLAFEHTEGTVDVHPLSEQLNLFGRVCVPILEGKIRDKNLHRLLEVIGALGDTEYLDSLFNSLNFTELRDDIAAELEKLLSVAGVMLLKVDTRVVCQVSNCTDMSPRSNGSFQRSDMCVRHHYKHFHRLILKPTLCDFLVDERASAFLADFLDRCGQLNAFHCLRAIEADFKSVSSAVSRLREAKRIQRKFLCLRAPMKVDINEESFDTLAYRFEQIENGPNQRIPFQFFSAIEDELRALLDELFNAEFVRSAEFASFSERFRLPQELELIAMETDNN